MSGLIDLLSGGLVKDIGSIAEKYFPPNMSQEDKAKYRQDLQQIANSHQERLQELQNAEMAATVEDRKSARLSLTLSSMPQILSFMLTGFIVGIVYLLFYKGVPVESKDTLLVVLGIVIKEWGGSMQFWFGTTRGSQEKDRIIAQSDPLKPE